MRVIPLYAKDKTLKGLALVDDDDFERINGRRWHQLRAGYAARSTPRPDRRMVYMHREVLGLEFGDGREVDHINRNKLDNRRANLRLVTRWENGQNVPARAGSSRFRGVSWNTRLEKWDAYVCAGGRKYQLGWFVDETDAAEAASFGRRVLFTHSVEGPPRGLHQGALERLQEATRPKVEPIRLAKVEEETG